MVKEGWLWLAQLGMSHSIWPMNHDPNCQANTPIKQSLIDILGPTIQVNTEGSIISIEHMIGGGWRGNIAHSGSANERQCYFVTTSLIGWAQA